MDLALFIGGVLTGLLAAYLLSRAGKREREKALREIHSLNQDCFSRLSLEALEKNSRIFLSMAGETLKSQAEAGEKTLEGKQQLIDAGLGAMIPAGTTSIPPRAQWIM